jgi:hypothetical protein
MTVNDATIWNVTHRQLLRCHQLSKYVNNTGHTSLCFIVSDNKLKKTFPTLYICDIKRFFFSVAVGKQELVHTLGKFFILVQLIYSGWKPTNLTSVFSLRTSVLSPDGTTLTALIRISMDVGLVGFLPSQYL